MTGSGTTSAEDRFRAGYVALVGRPNAGKSTLLNALLGQKLSIVSSKPQTTRHRIVGILNGDGFQVVFLDTPGMIEPKYLLQNSMMKAVHSALRDADLLVRLVDASIVPPAGEAAVEEAFTARLTIPEILVLNKTDIAAADQVRRLSERAAAGARPPRKIVQISALRGTGLDLLREDIVSFLPFHPPYYPDDSLSDANERFFVAEIIREKIFECYREEIPYSTTVRILAFEEKAGRKDRIEAEICVERESQKGILIGGRGAALKKVGQLARADIETFLDRPVFLELRVKVREKWRDDRLWLQRLGYSEPND
jgi:GTP-binding protein Era